MRRAKQAGRWCVHNNYPQQVVYDHIIVDKGIVTLPCLIGACFMCNNLCQTISHSSGWLVIKSMSSAKRRLHNGLPPMTTMVRWSYRVFRTCLLQMSNSSWQKGQIFNSTCEKSQPWGTPTVGGKSSPSSWSLYSLLSASNEILRVTCHCPAPLEAFLKSVMLQTLFDQDVTVQNLFNSAPEWPQAGMLFW